MVLKTLYNTLRFMYVSKCGVLNVLQINFNTITPSVDNVIKILKSKRSLYKQTSKWSIMDKLNVFYL